jgi:hypothetical protein
MYDLLMDLSSPTVLWRLWHPRGQKHARAVVIPGSPHNTLTFFTNDVMDRAENFDELDIALFRAEDVKTNLMNEGWREED